MRFFSKVGLVALAAVLVTSLSGCFVIPLADGRSPIDDPFGVRKSQLRKAIPVLQAALNEVNTDNQWDLEGAACQTTARGRAT